MENITHQQPMQPAPQPKKLSNAKIIGINLGVLLIYELLCFAVGGEGITGLLFLIPIHFVVCLIAALVDRSRWPGWVISAFLAAIIGFSTCVGGLSLGGMH